MKTIGERARCWRREFEYERTIMFQLTVDYVNELLAAARAEEREACAQIAESANKYTQFQAIDHHKIAHCIASEIRKRGAVCP